jgi:hypothetical protein
LLTMRATSARSLSDKTISMIPSQGTLSFYGPMIAPRAVVVGAEATARGWPSEAKRNFKFRRSDCPASVPWRDCI